MSTSRSSRERVAICESSTSLKLLGSRAVVEREIGSTNGEEVTDEESMVPWRSEVHGSRRHDQAPC